MSRALGLITVLLVCASTLTGTEAVAQTAAQEPAGVPSIDATLAPEAQFEEGMKYHSGTDVLQNFATAALWFEAAAQQGFAPAQNQLGQYLFTGHGGDKNPEAALTWLKAAASSGDATYLFDYASALEAAPKGLADPAAAAQAYAHAAEQGHLESIVSLGVLFQNGLGVPQDLSQAKQLYEHAADENHPRAQNNLGLLYVRGDGVPQDYARAAALFAAAAESGLQVAMTNLGVMYENGFGVPLDEALAADLYRQGAGQASEATASPAEGPFYDPRLTPPDTSDTGLAAMKTAAAAGDPIAQFQLAWLMLSDPELDVSAKRRAATFMEAAAKAGLAPAMANMAALYAEGVGVHQDYVLAHMWLIRAKQAGHEGDPSLWEALASAMTVAQVGEAQTRAQLAIAQALDVVQ